MQPDPWLTVALYQVTIIQETHGVAPEHSEHCSLLGFVIDAPPNLLCWAMCH